MRPWRPDLASALEGAGWDVREVGLFTSCPRFPKKLPVLSERVVQKLLRAKNREFLF